MRRVLAVRPRALLCAAAVAFAGGCRASAIALDPAPRPMPATLSLAADSGRARDRRTDSTTVADIGWRQYFADTTLLALVDTAVHNNAELQATLAEVEMARQEARAIQGRLLPQVAAAASLGVDKAARYTSTGAGDASTDITPGSRVPEVLPDLGMGFVASWEADVRGRIRSRKGAALARYLATVEGNRYVMTGLVAEVANTYYELTALDAKLAIIREAIALQERELEVVRAQKDAAVVTELAVRQFEALLFDARGMEFEVRQQIREGESRMNLLLGRYPRPVQRAPMLVGPTSTAPPVHALDQGLPSQLLRNRPDIRGAELQLTAARLDVKAARAELFPELGLTGALGLRAFKSRYLFTTPESIAWSLVGDLFVPILNRKSLKAEVAFASANQKKALYAYRQTVLTGFTEVSTLSSALDNLDSLYTYKAQRAETLDRSIEIASELFNATRANYLEVLTAQREAIDAKLEVVETRLRREVAATNLYRALGGGWK